MHGVPAVGVGTDGRHPGVEIVVRIEQLGADGAHVVGLTNVVLDAVRQSANRARVVVDGALFLQDIRSVLRVVVDSILRASATALASDPAALNFAAASAMSAFTRSFGSAALLANAAK